MVSTGEAVVGGKEAEPTVAIVVDYLVVEVAGAEVLRAWEVAEAAAEVAGLAAEILAVEQMET